jgi:O-antigen/teichoic acid export membrane protein
MNFRQINHPSFRMIAGLASSPLYRNSFFMAFGNIFNAGCGFIFWIVAAQLYTIEQVGFATALISSLGLVVLISRLGFESSMIRFFSTEDRAKVISTSLIVTTATCIIAGMIYIFLAEFFVPSMRFLTEPGFALAFLLIGVVNSAASVTGSAFIADRKADSYFLQNLFNAIRIPALVPLTFVGVFGIFGSVGLGYLVAAVFGLAALQRSIGAIQTEVDRDYIRRSFRFSSWNYISSILFVAPTLIIPIMVLDMLGAAEAANYYIAFTLGNLVLIIPSSFGTSLFVEGSHGERLKKSVLRAGSASLVMMLPAVLILFLFGDRLLGLVKGEYVEAFDLLRIVALSSFPVAIYCLFVPIQNVRMRVESIVLLNVLRSVLLLGLSYVLMQWFGILGAGYAWMITYWIIFLVIVIVVKKERWIEDRDH